MSGEEGREPADPVDHSIEAIARLHASHKQRSTWSQRFADRFVAAVGRPLTLVMLSLLVAVWVMCNLAGRRLGMPQFDAPPFQWLELGCSFVALYMTILILITQRHDDELAQHREQLTLQLAILSEQKAAKIIELLEAIREDSPHLLSREDAHATAMAKPVDPQSVLEALKAASTRS